MNHGQFPGTCGNTVTITRNGVSVNAVVVDMCPGCGYSMIDASPAVFNALASADLGVVDITWEWSSGGGQTNKQVPTQQTNQQPANQQPVNQQPVNQQTNNQQAPNNQ